MVVENVYIAYNFSHFAICLPKFIKLRGNLTKLWQKQKCTFFERRCRHCGRKQLYAAFSSILVVLWCSMRSRRFTQSCSRTCMSMSYIHFIRCYALVGHDIMGLGELHYSTQSVNIFNCIAYCLFLFSPDSNKSINQKERIKVTKVTNVTARSVSETIIQKPPLVKTQTTLRKQKKK